MRAYFLTVSVAASLMISSCAAQPEQVRIAAVIRSDGSVYSVEEYVSVHQVAARMEELRARPDVVIVGEAGARRVHSDPLLVDQWGSVRLSYDRVDGELASPSSITVAVLDTGVDGTHPDLAGRVLPGFDVVSGSGPADYDPNGHGTHVAGIIAAVAGNGLGVAGFASGVSVLPVRVLRADGYGDDADLATGIVWAVDAGADLVNMSVGGAEDMGLLRDAVSYAFERGVLLVASAGNDALWGNAPSFPAAYPEVVAVAATTAGDRRAMFSNTGSYVELSAPGSSIVSTWPGGRYIYSSGTSMAAPFVAASAALVMASTGARGQALRGLLTGSALDIGSPGRDDSFGFGMVDPFAASSRAPIASSPPSVLPSPGGLPGLPELPELPTFDLPPLPELSELLPGLPELPAPGTLPELPTFDLPPLPELSELLPGLPEAPLPSAPSASRQETEVSASMGDSGLVHIRLMGPRALVAFRSVSWSFVSDAGETHSGDVRLDTDGAAYLEVPKGSGGLLLEYPGSLTTLPSSFTFRVG